LTPVWLAAIAAVIVVSFSSWLWSTADSTTVIVIRHAEKQLGAAADPPLSAAGEARAQRLAQMFGDPAAPGRVSAIIVSPWLRSRSTAAPLASRLALTLVERPADDAREIARVALHRFGGGRVLIVAHADTVPKIVAALCGRSDIPPMADLEYDTMYIVTVPRIGRANLLRLRY
jgi:broad specificity phosphatase PhoE